MAAQPTIVHYDFANILYSSFYSTGFLLNASKYGYRFEISRKPPKLLLEVDAVAVSGSGTWRSRPLYRLKSDSEDYFFCVDTADHNLAYDLPLLQNVAAYFKVNYDADCIPRDSAFAAYVNRIQPILPFFPLRSGNRLRRVPRLRSLSIMDWNHRAALRRIIDLRKVPSIDALRTLRGSAKRHDIFFVSQYYSGASSGDPMMESMMEFRYKVMEELERQGFRHSLYGFATRTALPKPFSRYAMRWLSSPDYLRALAESRIAIYGRGILECISFKFGEYLSLGLPVVGQKIANNRETLMGFPHFDEQFAFDDPRDLVLQASTLLKHNERRRVLGESNARVFDTMLAPEAVTGDVLERLGMRRWQAEP